MLGYVPLLFFVSFLSAAVQAVEYSREEQDLLLLYGDEEMITIATGEQQPLSKAPAVANVITAEQIRRMGATDLDEVLESVPGLHVSRSASYSPLYLFRGIASSFNAEVLMLINGVPINTLFVGDRNQVWGGMPVQAIARVEVIRGPGAAIYGADAFAGVINVITKNAADINGTEVGLRYGSFASQEVWLLHGSEWAGWQWAFALEGSRTDGANSIIEQDAQSGLDQLLGSQASLAPGPVNLQRNNVDLRLELGRGNFVARLGLQRRTNSGVGVGVASALDPNGRLGSDRWNLDLNYHNVSLAEDWDISSQLSFYDTSQVVEQNLHLFPAGSLGFQEGVIGNPEVFERHLRGTVSASYAGFFSHRIRLGLGYAVSDLYRVNETKNFTFSAGSPLPMPLGGVQDVSDSDAVFLSEGKRKNAYVFLQDIWKLANDWELTSGVRLDDYSDFGQTVNPRLALVWSMGQNSTLKLLHGQAFRAPAFVETQGRNNPVALGNADLKPETIQTTELAFEYYPQERLRLSTSLFRYVWQDIIRFETVDPSSADLSKRAQNSGSQSGAGLEFEIDWRVNSDLHLMLNSAYQYSHDERSGQSAANAPNHQLYLQANWHFHPAWSLNSRLNLVMSRARETGDLREEVADYSTLDVSVRRRSVVAGWAVAVGVRNLSDTDRREPSSAEIPNDLPLSGRNAFAELSYTF
ncbi:MAG: TonB-dependent receptor [Gammaproteobacteria bacterium]|nr:TonB-dependent receptor [Gammaproteobacteria bacterium]